MRRRHPRLRDLGAALAGLAALVLVALFAGAVINAFQRASAAERARTDTATSARRRIDLLNKELASLNSAATVNGDRIGELTAQVASLSEQVRQLGGKPVVVATPSPITSNSSGSPATSTSTTRPPSPTTTTTRPTCTTLPILGRCA